MASDLLSIGKSGTMAARAALDVTAQNIANAGTEGYVRRSAVVEEVSAASGVGGRVTDISLSGVRVSGVVRHADMFRQSEVRRTGADAARADAEVSGLENIEAALEQSGAYDAIVKFESSLQQLTSDPVDPALRASAVENARTMTRTMNIASQAIDQAGKSLRFEATDGVNQVNTLGSELARVNLRLARSADTAGDRNTLLDQRDSLLEKLSNYTDVDTTFAADGTVSVKLGGASGPSLVTGGTATALGMTTATDGTIAFDVGGTAISPTGGSLTGKQLALVSLRDANTNLNAIAKGVIDTINAAQGNGVALNGATGSAMFSGTGAGDMTLVMTDGSQLATAPAGAGANSRDQGNLQAMMASLSTADPAGKTDSLIFQVSSAVQGRTITRDALDSIASTAKIALQTQAGVSLDNEAANLIRFQQAFQASSRVMAVAQETFNSILAIR